MIRSYKYRLYPNKTQIQLLDKALIWHRIVYNTFLEERIDAYTVFNKTITCFDQMSQIKELRSEIPDIQSFSASSFQQTARKLDKAYSSFFKRVKSGQVAGFPRFKTSKRFNSFASLIGDGSGVKLNKLYIKGVGSIKVKWHRQLPDEAKLKQVVVKREADKWYATFQFEIPDIETTRTDDNKTGLDLGLESFAVLSNGEQISNNRFFVNAEKKLKRLNRSLSRKKRGSRNWHQAAKHLSRFHSHIANKRHDFLHKISRELANKYSFISIEDLNIKNMKNKYLNKSIGDAGWGYFVSMLEYKTQETGSVLIKVNPAYTSQTCSGCGKITKKSLSQRTHSCDCGLKLSRDHNAAINILRLGLSLQTPMKVIKLSSLRSQRLQALE